MTKVFEGDLVLEKDTVFDEGIEVNGNITGKNGVRYGLKVEGNISALDISAGDISAGDISALDISAGNISAWDISAWDISAKGNISYYAFCIAYKNIKCKSIKGRRENSFHKALDGEITTKKGVVV